LQSLRRLADVLGLINLMGMRLRAIAWRIRGARIARKCGFGARLAIDRPWRVFVGTRATFESDVWIKVVADTASVVIGEYTFIGRGTEIDASCDVKIGDHVLIGPGVFITDHNHNIAAGLRIDEQGCSASEIVIGDDVWLGAGVIVLPGVTIGKGAVVGAGAVVTKGLPEYSVSVGAPARVIRQRVSP